MDQLMYLEIKAQLCFAGGGGWGWLGWERGCKDRQTRDRAHRTWDGTSPEEHWGAAAGFSVGEGER